MFKTIEYFQFWFWFQNHRLFFSNSFFPKESKMDCIFYSLRQGCNSGEPGCLVSTKCLTWRVKTVINFDEKWTHPPHKQMLDMDSKIWIGSYHIDFGNPEPEPKISWVPKPFKSGFEIQDLFRRVISLCLTLQIKIILRKILYFWLTINLISTKEVLIFYNSRLLHQRISK